MMAPANLNGSVTVAEALMASVRLQRLQDENALLLEALRQIVMAGRRSKIKSGHRHYYAMSASKAFEMGERCICALEGRPEEALDDLAARLTIALTISDGGEPQKHVELST